MKVLITGGGGFIGSHLAEGHLDRGDEVWSVDTGMNLKVRHLLPNKKFHYVKASVLDEAAMEAFVIRADLVYHHAAVVGVEHYVDDPFNVLNVNISNGEVPYNGTAGPAREDGAYNTFALNSPQSFLVTGTNIIAIQAANDKWRRK